jgi:3-hydroxymyristoyl/3-hydroxydecanoyl-(acyl carrier protein) dehydratase
MPGVLIVEAIAQTAGIMIADVVDPATKAALIASIDGVKIRRPVIPGDQLRIEVFGTRIKTSTADIHGIARVGDQIAAEARIRFVIVAANRDS